MIQQTTIEAYEKIKVILNERQRMIHRVLFFINGGATNSMIAKASHLPINCITPRIYELRKKGMVIERFRGICPITGHSAIFWEAVK